MNHKENYLAALRQEKTEWVPSGLTASVSIGFDDLWFEKGPKGGGYDGFGVRWVRPTSGAGAPIPAPGEFILQDVTKWKELSFPNVDDFDWEGLFADFKKNTNREEKAVDFGCGNGQFERLGALMGFEEALMAMYEEPEAVYDLLGAITDYKIKVVEKAAKYLQPDTFTNFDDTCTQNMPFMSPEVYHELISPHHKRLNEACRELGILPLQHCCGKGEPLVKYFVEEKAAAWTVVQPCNDIVSILNEYGDQIAISGGFDTNGLPGIALREDLVREDVRRCMREYGDCEGYVFGAFIMVPSEKADLRPSLMAAMLDEYNKCL